jgi:hypothetical protein
VIKRRTERLFLRIPVAVSGEDSFGNSLSEESKTVHISRYGALVELRRLPRAGSQLAIRNLSNGLMANSRIIHTHELVTGSRVECGIELLEAPRDFWGVVFEDPPSTEELRISALLFCTICGQKVFASLSPEEYRAMETETVLRRPCPRCAEATEWVVGPSEEEEEEKEPTPSSAPAQASTTSEQPAKPREEKSGIERRQARRLALKVPLRVQSSDGPAESTVAEDMSKTGFKFGCSLEFAPGDLIRISVGQGVASNPPVHTYKVVWRIPKEKSKRYLYGVTVVDRQ